MKIIITGVEGQLGYAFRKTLKNEELYLTDLPKLDLVSHQATLDYFQRGQPELVIHCAAMTNVDGCELNPDSAYLNNVIATKNVVNACQITGAVLVYISTDYVFDGRADRPYREYDPVNPINVYGKTKWQGEEIVKMHLDKFFIFRTAWLFGDIGHNFIWTIYQNAIEGKTLRIVNDQTGSPTYAADLASAIVRLIDTKVYGIYHITNNGCCTWFEFAKSILEQANLKEAILEPISSAELNRPAPRPGYSVLAKDASHLLGIEMPSFQNALQRYLDNFSIN